MKVGAPFQIDVATPSDAAAVAGLSRDHVESGLGWSWRPERIRRHVAARHSIVIVARDHGRVIAGAVAVLLPDYARLNLLVVSPTHRRIGVATRLLSRIEQLAARQARVIHLEVRKRNRGARAFYRSLGYQALFEIPRYYGGAETAVRMFRGLPS